jgi:hypothetical protein
VHSPWSSHAPRRLPWDKDSRIAFDRYRAVAFLAGVQAFLKSSYIVSGPADNAAVFVSFALRLVFLTALQGAAFGATFNTSCAEDDAQCSPFLANVSASGRRPDKWWMGKAVAVVAAVVALV